jgi:TonB-linked SusC/RagA family outer membrane protein
MLFLNRSKRGTCNFCTLLPRQIWRAMRLIILLLTAAFLQVSAEGNAQGQITLNLKNAPLEKVFSEISKQTGMSFFYDDAILQKARLVNIKVSNATLKQTLDLTFKDQPLSFVINDKTVVVQRKSESFSNPIENANDAVDVKGKVVNENGQPVAGANVKVKGTSRGTTTNERGDFELTSVDENAVLEITHVNIEPFEIPINGRMDLAFISVKTRIIESETVTVTANTGYQEIPLHQSTGSVDVISNKQLNVRPSTDILRRIDGWTPGVLFDGKYVSGLGDNSITIRGRSTIYSNTKPIIVLDNFPYDGDITNINPNDVESITILKDAAAASIWGAKAGNGVIVITTKKGAYNREPVIEFNSAITVTPKPDLTKVPSIASGDFIEVEKMLFANGYYSNFEANQQFFSYPFTPVIELLIAKRDGLIPASDVDSQIEELKKIDVRNYFHDFFYRASINQQYAVNVKGGTSRYKYYMSAGYDKNLDNKVGIGHDRFTIRSNNTFVPIKNMELTAGIQYIQSKRMGGNNPGYGGVRLGWGYHLYPYASLVDASGNHVPIIKDHRLSYDLNSSHPDLLDWTYNPISDIHESKNSDRITDITINAGLNYQIMPELKLEMKYQFEHSGIQTENLRTKNSYFARDMVNKFSQLNADGSITRVIPVGGLSTISSSELNSDQFRINLNFHRTFSEKHEVNAIVGNEIKETIVKSIGYPTKYGYDESTGNSFSQFDYNTDYQMFDNQFDNRRIGHSEYTGELTDRYFSYFGNAGYTYDGRYTISLSGRIDQSNLFGVSANQRKAPLWSTGMLWDISRESFYKLSWLPKLALRTSYGYNGNINKNVTAFTTARLFPSLSTGLPYLNIINPPNEELRWEKVKIINTGVEFEIGRRPFLIGNIQYYWKNGIDLIGSAPLDPTAGFLNPSNQSVFTGNVASMKGHGIDASITILPINRQFRWQSDIIFSYAISKVTDFAQTSNIGKDYLSISSISPLIGKPIYSVFSYKWAKLDPTNGDPQGYLDKVISKDYGAIIGQTTLDEMVYNGPGLPPYFGSFRNTFSFKGISLLVNISYSFGYYFRRSSINYSELYEKWAGHADYSRRWQNPGDEMFTEVPSMIYPVTSQRDAFYHLSEALVEKGDHVRLQDVNLSYQILKKSGKMPFKSLRFTIYASNLGIIWQATNRGIDPLYNGSIVPNKSFAVGLNATF